jgi:hypothetical protein
VCEWKVRCRLLTTSREQSACERAPLPIIHHPHHPPSVAALLTLHKAQMQSPPSEISSGAVCTHDFQLVPLDACLAGRGRSGRSLPLPFFPSPATIFCSLSAPTSRAASSTLYSKQTSRSESLHFPCPRKRIYFLAETRLFRFKRLFTVLAPGMRFCGCCQPWNQVRIPCDL